MRFNTAAECGGQFSSGDVGRKVESFAKEFHGGKFEFATKKEEREDLWRARKEAYWSAYALRPNSEIWTTDVCVPVSRLSEIIVETKKDILDAKLVAPIIAHAGDGNFHVLILIDPKKPEEIQIADAFNRRLVKRAIDMGGKPNLSCPSMIDSSTHRSYLRAEKPNDIYPSGTCTGEHGVGEGKMDFLEMEHGKDAVDLMRKIKAAIDPNNIMNPGKVLPRENDVRTAESVSRRTISRGAVC